MRPHSRATGVAFRRAVWASVAFHVLVAGALMLFVRTGERVPTELGIDTRAEPQVRMSLPEVAVSVEVAPPAPSAAPPLAAESTATPAPQGPPLVALRPSPQTLPSELIAIIRKPSVVESPVTPVAPPTTPATPAAPTAPVADPNVRPATGTVASETLGAATAPATPAIHGALAPNQTVVYVLDCSGSMGAAGKLDAARAALVSTLKQQPATVQFQIITYAGTATPLLAGNGTALPATEANIRAAADKLAALEARGKSNHAAAIRTALGFRPDVVLMLTDADDLTATTLKSALASAPKPVPICVGQVTAAGVQRSRELK